MHRQYIECTYVHDQLIIATGTFKLNQFERVMHELMWFYVT